MKQVNGVVNQNIRKILYKYTVKTDLLDFRFALYYPPMSTVTISNGYIYVKIDFYALLYKENGRFMYKNERVCAM